MGASDLVEVPEGAAIQVRDGAVRVGEGLDANDFGVGNGVKEEGLEGREQGIMVSSPSLMATI